MASPAIDPVHVYDVHTQARRLFDWVRPLAQAQYKLLLHEVHHRAQAMAMLHLLGVPAQTLDYIQFVQQRNARMIEQRNAGRPPA